MWVEKKRGELPLQGVGHTNDMALVTPRHTGEGGGGGLGTCEMWKCGEDLAPTLKYHGKLWYKITDCGTRRSIAREWWSLFATGLWLLAVISWRPRDGCPYFLEAVGHNGNVRTKSAKN